MFVVDFKHFVKGSLRDLILQLMIINLLLQIRC